MADATKIGVADATKMGVANARVAYLLPPKVMLNMEFRGRKLTVPKMLIKRLLKIFGKTLNYCF